MAVSPAAAQVVDLGGVGGPSIDLRSDRQRERDYRRAVRERDYDRDIATGSVRGGCRTVTIRDTDDYGRTVVRRREECR